MILRARRGGGCHGLDAWRHLFQPSGTSHLLPLRLPEHVGQGVRCPNLVLFGHLGVDGRGLDAGVAELLLDDLQVAPAGPVEVSGVGVAARVGSVPGIQAHGGHKALDYRAAPIRLSSLGFHTTLLGGRYPPGMPESMPAMPRDPHSTPLQPRCRDALSAHECLMARICESSDVV